MGVRVRCVSCGNPTRVRFAEAMGFDTEWVLCASCKPRTVRKPRVTLFGAPDGQELGRWTK